MFIDKSKVIRASKSPNKLTKQASDSAMSHDTLNKVSSTGRLKKIANDSREENISCDKCDKCLASKENLSKAINHVKTYVDTINERLNSVYHKISSSKKIGAEFDPSLSPEYLHAIFYSNLDKMKISREMTTQFRSLMKSVRFFNDKFDYIIKKHENFEVIAQEYRKLVLSNKFEDVNVLPEADMNDVKSLDIQNLFKNFNMAKDGFEGSFKEIKNMVNGNYEKSQNNTQNETKSLESLYADYSDQKSEGKDSFLRNELARLAKENISLKLEMNYIYEKLREDNKLFEIREDMIINKPGSKENVLINQNSNTLSTNLKNSQKSIRSYNSTSMGSSSPNGNPVLVFQVKNDKITEDFLIAKNYIKVLKHSEFFMG